MRVTLNSIKPRILTFTNNSFDFTQDGSGDTLCPVAPQELYAFPCYSLLTEQQKAFAKDKEYRKTLAAAIGCPVENLKAVVGVNELTYLLKNRFDADNFYPGKNYENVENGNFRINMHLHTRYSYDAVMSIHEVLDRAEAYALEKGNFPKDKTLSIPEVLDNAEDYARQNGKPFYVAITDHNAVGGAAEAIKILGENPEKYRHIKFIPGIEMRSEHNYTKNHDDKIYYETLIYCINPFGKSINNLLTEKAHNSHERNINSVDMVNYLKGKPVLYSIAHPGRIRFPEEKSRHEFLSQLQNIGYKAIEGYYSYENFTYGGFSDKDVDRKFLPIAEEMGFLKTGGRDSHYHSIIDRK